MDQVKAALGWLKEHHFWILALVVVGLSVGGWFTATGELAQKYSSAKGKIESTLNSQRSIAGKPFKPNESVNEKQQEQNVALAASVKQIWDELYNAQKEEVLKWPTQLGQSFLKRIAKKSFGDSIVRDDRDRYLNYIKQRFPQLLEIVDAAPGGSRSGAGAIGRGGGMATEGFGPSVRTPGVGSAAEEPEHLIDWVDQETLQARMSFVETPSALQIWVTQEDLWVYETLLTAIAKTNQSAGATRRSNAAIRVIEQLQVGASAAVQTQSTGRIFVPESGGGGGLAGGGLGGGRGGGRGGGFGGGPGMGGFEGGGRGMGGGGFGGGRGGGGFGGMPGGSADDGALLEGRYVDETGQPVAVPPGTFTVGVEYKQLPVLMQLEMDSRWLTELIVNLANAPLQVKIDQVRVNPEGSDFGGRAGGKDVKAFDRTPTIQPVVLQGSVYIFNEPEEETFKVGGDEI
ncbi:MAG: hypothetical protein AAFV43_00450 [Planctomycetota bacterium]